jgi:hypothetical protein
MHQVLDVGALRAQNDCFRGTGGVSDENRSLGFEPAFMDTDSGVVHRARFGDGQPAPFHILDGLPPCLVCERDACGRVLAVKASIIAGFVSQGRFLTRDQAAQALAA